MHEHPLDTILEGDCAGVARSAGTAKLQLHVAVFEAPEVNIATILLDRRPDSSLQELLDHADNLAVIFVVRQAVLFHLLIALLPLRHVDKLLAGCDCLGNQGEDLWSNVGPVRIPCLGDGDEVCAVKHRRDAINVHELRGERRRVWRRDGRPRVKIFDERRVEVFGHDSVVWQEFESIFIGCFLGLYENVTGAPDGQIRRHGAAGERWSSDGAHARTGT